MKNYYQILGVSPSASSEEIKERYRFLVKAYHPDRFTTEKEKSQASKEMQQINEAYSVLSDSEQRSKYDRKIGISTNENSEHGQGNASEKLDERSKYIVSLINKWDVFNINLPYNPQRVQLIRDLRLSISDLSHFLGAIFPSTSNTIGEEQQNKSIAFIVAASFAIGAESAKNGLEKGFRQQDLEIQLAIIGLAAWFSLVEKASDNPTIQSKATRTIEVAYLLIKTCIDDGYRWILEKNPKNNYEQDKKNNNQYYCNSCYKHTQTAHASFGKNIGMLFARSYQKIEGNLCSECIERYFWSFTMKTVLFGWWGVISLIVSPFIIFLNIINYLSSIFSLGYKRTLLSIKWGWKIIAMFIILVLFIGALPYSNQEEYRTVSSYSQINPTPTKKPSFPTQSALKEIPYPTYTSLPLRPTQTSQIILRPTSTSIKTNPLGVPVNCKKWSEVTTSFEGKKICVYGQIQSVYWGDDGRFFIRFSKSNNDAFRFVVVYGYYDVKANECVYATGIVKKFGKMPYIELGEKDFLYLYRCT